MNAWCAPQRIRDTDGARATDADVDFAWRAAAPATAGRGEVGGLRRSIDKFRGTDTPTLRRPLSPSFPAGDLLVFIPWRVVAAESGAAPSAARCFRPARAADFVLVWHRLAPTRGE